MTELRFDNRSVIVTGAGRGFGRCHALLFASRGARVVVADYGVNLDGTGSAPEPAERVVREIVAAGGEAVPCFASIADPDGAAKIVETAMDAFGGLDILVNNAGVADPDWFGDTDPDRFHRTMHHQYFGTVLMCKEAWPHLQAADGGCIVNTVSEALAGFVPKCANDSGANGAVFSFTRSLALDGRRGGVRVNAVCPRGITRMSAPEVMASIYDQPPDVFHNPFLDAMRPEFASAAVAFLAHPSCSLTGETLICGGLRVMRLTFVESKGMTSEAGMLRPEDIADNLDVVMDTTDACIRGLDYPDPE